MPSSVMCPSLSIAALCGSFLASCLPTAAISCESNAECINLALGEPAVCDQSSFACIPLKRDGVCSDVFPPDGLWDDDAVLFGAFLPLQGEAPLSAAVALDYRLALNEIAAAGGVPGGVGGLPRPIPQELPARGGALQASPPAWNGHPLVGVFCDSAPDRVEAGVRHLVQTLRVPALIGLFSEADTMRLVQDYTLPAGAFFLNPQSEPEALRTVAVDQMVWNILGPASEVARAYRPLLVRAEAFLRTRLKEPTRDLKLALLTSQDPFNEALERAVVDATETGVGIVLNGKTVAANEASGAIRRVRAPSVEVDRDLGLAKLVAELAAFEPDLVLLLTDDTSIVPGLEVQLLAGDSSATLPFYLLSALNARDASLIDYLSNDYNEGSARKRERFAGVGYAGSREPRSRDQWLRRMRDAYPEIAVATYSGSENFYDAVYWLAYGAAVAPSWWVQSPLRDPYRTVISEPVSTREVPAAYGVHLSGRSFSGGVGRLLAGPPVFPGDAQTIADAFVTMSTSMSGVSFVGAQGPPKGDWLTGSWRSEGSVFCYPPPALDPLGPAYDVLRYDADTGQLVGDFTCFPSF